MRLTVLALALFATLAACTPTSPVVVATTPPATATASPTVTPTPTPTESPSPSPSPTLSPTPFRTPRPPDSVLTAMARTTLDGIQLPKVFPYNIQLYEPLGNYHAGFGGFSSGVAILLVGRDDVKSNTLVHEYGHAWHEYFMKYDTKIWKEYGAIRGFIDPVQLSQGVNYLDDWRERFANDFQFAFNPDYGGAYTPGPGYWPPTEFEQFKAFVKALPSRALAPSSSGP